jgi:hypothetical protein
MTGYPVLRKVFRGKFVEALKQAFHNNQLYFPGDLTLLAQPKIFAAWLRPLFQKHWVVYSKPPSARPQTSCPFPTAAPRPAPNARKLHPNHSHLHSFQYQQLFHKPLS